MPTHLVLHKSGVHRTACTYREHGLTLSSISNPESTGFALCRALLRQVKQLPLAKSIHFCVQEQIKTIIKRNAGIQGHEIPKALRLGYEVRLS